MTSGAVGRPRVAKVPDYQVATDGSPSIAVRFNPKGPMAWEEVDP